MSKTLEERIERLEAKLEYLWAGNPEHPLDAADRVAKSGAEYPKQIGHGKDAKVVHSREEEDKLGASVQ
jgi:hypothetical protein